MKSKDYTVFITIKAKYQRGVVCDAMIHYTNYLFQIVYPLPGNWTVHCNEKIITVYVQESCYC